MVRTDTFLANVTLLTTVEVEVVVAEEEEAEVVDMVDAAVMYAIYIYIYIFFFLSFISNFWQMFIHYSATAAVNLDTSLATAQKEVAVAVVIATVVNVMPVVIAGTFLATVRILKPTTDSRFVHFPCFLDVDKQFICWSMDVAILLLIICFKFLTENGRFQLHGGKRNLMHSFRFTSRKSGFYF